MLTVEMREEVPGGAGGVGKAMDDAAGKQRRDIADIAARAVSCTVQILSDHGWINRENESATFEETMHVIIEAVVRDLLLPVCGTGRHDCDGFAPCGVANAEEGRA